MRRKKKKNQREVKLKITDKLHSKKNSKITMKIIKMTPMRMMKMMMKRRRKKKRSISQTKRKKVMSSLQEKRPTRSSMINKQVLNHFLLMPLNSRKLLIWSLSIG